MTETLYELPANRMVAAFMGNPPMNVFGVNYTGDGFQLGDQMIPTPIALRRVIKDKLQSGMRFEFGIRPEAIRIEPGLPHVRGTVLQVEPLEQTLLVRVGVPSTGGTVELLMVLGDSTNPPTIGSELPLAFDLKQMFLFDGGGDRIYPPMC
jgi:multiple sugar transport system ATP-binding protein